MRFNGVERTLLDFRFSHDRDTDLFGIPCTYPKDSFIRLSFAAEEGDGFSSTGCVAEARQIRVIRAIGTTVR